MFYPGLSKVLRNIQVYHHPLLHHLKEFFSVAGLTINKLRLNLSSENVNALLFLNKKLKEFQHFCVFTMYIYTNTFVVSFH